MHLLGFDLGSSFIKASVIDAASQELLASAKLPDTEQEIDAPQPGWAEQDPNKWWELLVGLVKDLGTQTDLSKISAIGISYQMHGLVIVDKDLQSIRPAIIWCDSRAVNTGASAFEEIGEERSLKHLLNSPGNFTASKLKWIQKNEPQNYERIYKFMLPGDFLAMKLSGIAQTTPSGLSEGIFWDYLSEGPSDLIFDTYHFSKNLIPGIVPNIGIQTAISAETARLLGLKESVLIAYRAGDQPNNALSLNVFEPGEVAATAGTSAVVYAVQEKKEADPKSRVNIFLHVNHESAKPRFGSLLCINGSGILYSWLKKNVLSEGQDYKELNQLAGSVKAGAAGLRILPFGNGAERILENRYPGASVHNLSLTTHTRAHLARAALEGILFSLRYGMDILEPLLGKARVIRAGYANLFLSETFAALFADVMDTELELYHTEGSQGAARGAGLGIGFYKSRQEAFAGLKKIKSFYPEQENVRRYARLYEDWKTLLETQLNSSLKKI